MARRLGSRVSGTLPWSRSPATARRRFASAAAATAPPLSRSLSPEGRPASLCVSASAGSVPNNTSSKRVAIALRREGRFIGEHLGQDQAERVHVRPGTRAGKGHLFRRGVIWREGEGSARAGASRGIRLFVAHDFGDTEVQDPKHVPMLGWHQHHVRGLDVSMNDPLSVGVSERVYDRAKKVYGQPLRRAAPSRSPSSIEVGRQRFPLQPFQRHPGCQLARGHSVDAEVIDRHHVGML